MKKKKDKSLFLYLLIHVSAQSTGKLRNNFINVNAPGYSSDSFGKAHLGAMDIQDNSLPSPSPENIDWALES